MRRRWPGLGWLTLWCVAGLLLAGGAAAQDTDSDGIADASDNCPALWNRTQDDRDGDGVGDVCDNCLVTGNGAQTDAGGLDSLTPDGVGDACACGNVQAGPRTDIADAAVL